MAIIKCEYDLLSYKLHIGDIVIFGANEEIEYRVADTHLVNESGSNSKIFKALDIERYEFCTKHYGYESNCGDWPECDYVDMAALTRVVRALYININHEFGTEETKMEKPNTQLEKNALAKAKADAIEKETEIKAQQYGSAMKEFIQVEREARSYRKQADELKDKLGITTNEMKELF